MKTKQTPEDFRVIERSEPRLSESGPFYLYRLRKKKLTTPEAIREVARANDLRPGAFAHAGLKDRQGVTEQLISVTGKPVRYESPQIKLRFLGRSDRAVETADSQGNRFEITLRRLRPRDVERLTESAAEIRRTGVPNYFDSQRFGCLRHGQGFVARYVIRGDYEEALRRLIASKSRFNTKDAQFKGYLRKHWGEWQDLADKHRRSLYGRLFSYLADHPGDFRGALKLVPLGTKLIHLCAYQSFLWNETLRRFLESELAPAPSPARKSGTGEEPRVVGDGPGTAEKDIPSRGSESGADGPGASAAGGRGGVETGPPETPAQRSSEPPFWLGSSYECGWLTFPRQVPTGQAAALKSLSIPLPAASTRPEDPRIARVLEQALQHEGLTVGDLGVKDIPGFLFKEEPRPVMLVPEGLSIREPEPDELNGGFLAVRLSFSLPRGAYGSLILKRLLAEAAPRNPRQREPRGFSAAERTEQRTRRPGRSGRRNERAKRGPSKPGRAPSRGGRPGDRRSGHQPSRRPTDGRRNTATRGRAGNPEESRRPDQKRTGGSRRHSGDRRGHPGGEKPTRSSHEQPSSGRRRSRGEADAGRAKEAEGGES